jgi:hypothetical protein
VNFDERIVRATGATLNRFGTTPAIVSQPPLDDQSWQGIYDEEPMVAMGSSTYDAQFTVASALLEGFDRKSAVISIKGVAYRARKIEPDGAGMTVIMLSRS